ncbi:MAG: mycofactocin biosynthesis FMN-dependent deaminase MftD [Actinobacteria bacterium]|nr:mycofactocin biosynthesis FMN-dependent deaminase MftD [Actinomycetota bacterium]NIS28794.1 mycofactocin biosynthesis FMN-dependent deaminase MftD [Actinomycetota bacterium]NIT94162.1 mycofactocin biosynthesis FMN-dependent deaminase MftD [Actinomycetota bacterium]NIU17780.1 mycofactocin biosynthesis FMN-dependent deaminase MftD [Actinomycetota bacterium]NIU64238.1 mycofactocin biosynthesis FMN-dependent deaminase MftD [Actinomycetota bacterium]
MSNAWFETVAVAQERAKKRLPKSVYGALIAGAEAGVSLRDNIAALDQLGFRPVTAGQPPERAMATTVMGQPASMPVMISPTGVQAVHPGGEVAVARASAARGIPMGLSSFGSKPLEDVVEANPQTMFQIYWAGDRDSMLGRLDRAERAGAVGLILTLDWSFSHGRDWGSPDIPQAFDLRTILRHAPEVLARPRWLASWLRTGRLPMLGVPNFPVGDQPVPGFFEAYGTWMGTPPATWDDVAWLRGQWDGPFMVKGVHRPDEARRAVEAGATCISVSNHGGNNVDGAPAPIRVLPEIVAEVGDEVEVVLDGGIRRGSDVVKAVALGARAVLIGRAYLWGLAANGQAGVENVLDILRNGIDATMRGIGRASLEELTPDDLVVPRDFFVTSG